jgi:hypothetical protein
MFGRNILWVFAAVVIGALALIQCGDKGDNWNGGGYLEVREWGVLVGCAADSSYFLTSRPEVSSLVRLPVIYVHTGRSAPFTIKATFPTGGPADTYPPADVSKSTVEWRDVRKAWPYAPDKLSTARGFVPLDSILPVLNAVDADVLSYRGYMSKFLFYEGAVSFSSRIAASYDLDSLIAHLRNNGTYPVYNVDLVVNLQAAAGPLPRNYYSHVATLNPQQSVDLLMTENPGSDYRSDMMAQGFTYSEAESFARLWEPSLYLTTATGSNANLIYRIPQTEYDKLIGLSVTPEPDKLVRTLYVLMHLDSSLVNPETQDLILGNWNWESSCGGFAYHCDTPDSVGYTTTWHFLSDSLFVEDRNDSTILTTSYRLIRDNHGQRPIDVLQITGKMPMQILSVSDTTLDLMDQCTDCYEHKFRRLPVR